MKNYKENNSIFKEWVQIKRNIRKNLRKESELFNEKYLKVPCKLIRNSFYRHRSESADSVSSSDQKRDRSERKKHKKHKEKKSRRRERSRSLDNPNKSDSK